LDVVVIEIASILHLIVHNYIKVVNYEVNIIELKMIIKI